LRYSSLEILIPTTIIQHTSSWSTMLTKPGFEQNEKGKYRGRWSN